MEEGEYHQGAREGFEEGQELYHHVDFPLFSESSFPPLGQLRCLRNCAGRIDEMCLDVDEQARVLKRKRDEVRLGASRLKFEMRPSTLDSHAVPSYKKFEQRTLHTSRAILDRKDTLKPG